MPTLSRARGAHETGPNGQGLPQKGARRVSKGVAAVDLAFAPLASGEGARVGFLGDPGSGKTYAARLFAAEYLRRSRGLVAIVNSKGEAGWQGEAYASVGELRDRPNRSRQIVFTPPRGGDLDLHEIALWQWTMAVSHRCRSLLVWDEIADAASDGEWLDVERRRGGAVVPNSSQIGRGFTHGRALGMSELWGAQFAQQVPREAYETASCLCVWRQAGNALRILRLRGYTDGGVEDVIAALPGDDVPPADRGAFVVLRRGRLWNGMIYRF